MDIPFAILILFILMVTWQIHRDFGYKKTYYLIRNNERFCVDETYVDGCWYLYYSDGTQEQVSDTRYKCNIYNDDWGHMTCSRCKRVWQPGDEPVTWDEGCKV